MAKEEKSAPKAETKSEPMPQTGCVVCGSYGGTFAGSAGNARWHAECAANRPDVIAKVIARV